VTGRAAGLADGYVTTPVVVNGVVYTQDQESNVMAIQLATGKVLWTHDYNSLNGGPDGVNVVGGTAYTASRSATRGLPEDVSAPASDSRGRGSGSGKETGRGAPGVHMLSAAARTAASAMKRVRSD